MIEELKPYSDYRNSRQAWIGRLPSHWQVKPCRALFTEVRDRNPGNEQMLSVTIGRGVIPQARQLEGTGKRDSSRQDKSNYKLVCPGDIAYNKMRAWQGALGRSSLRGIISPAYVVQRPRESNFGIYFHHVARTPAFAKEAERWSYGITSDMWSLRPEHFKMIYCPVPPPEEQEAIARFLDHANRRIDQFIKSKRKLIALLNEQKQAIIHRAVTRGLNPSVKLKDSGVPWLGQAPAHWRVTRLKFEASHIIDCLHATPPYRPDGIFPAIRTADVEPGRLRLQQARRLREPDFLLWTQRLEPAAGDILYTREGERFGLAAPVPAGVRLCISQRMMVFRIRPTQYSAYVMWQLNCPHVYQQASEHIIGSTSPHVNVEQIKNYLLVLPPREEQARIVAHIETELSAISPVLTRAEKEIVLAREYRARLISDIVTGQLDVRAAAATTPDLGSNTAPADADDDEDTEIEDSEAA